MKGFDKIKIKVCDSIMGSGKSQSAISLMREGENNYIYLAPYLDEVDRILKACSEKDFIQPENKGSGKLENLHHLLKTKQNISSTHALFSGYTKETANLIRDGNYVLIMDEVFNVMEPVKITKYDVDAMFKSELITLAEDGESIVWLADDYNGEFNYIKLKAKSGTLIYYKEMILYWQFPVEIFKSFKEVIILTYLFDSQIQKYYYDIFGIEVEHMGVVRDAAGGYHFGERNFVPESAKGLKNKIHILDNPKLNCIGDGRFTLSASWYEREKKKKNKPLIMQMKNNLVNLYKHIYFCASENRMWTCFKNEFEHLKGKGYTLGFVSCNLRASNNYRNKTHLAYCVNIYLNPVLKNYFLDHGVNVKEDEYALSEMLQWIWRSAIRDGKDIWVYIPSKRMRNLLIDWLNTLESEVK